ncbi:hypothetical protein VTL71DRAFT_820 [Oculimacula yallundae]|uniref:Suppressor of anucleate metulae protein B n=1 Tax=Oculimacula yallundae TaxID=86028 RepID=A0ABR4D155_9HELO
MAIQIHMPEGMHKIHAGPSNIFASRTGVFASSTIYEFDSGCDFYRAEGKGLAIIGQDRAGLGRACDSCFRTFYMTHEGIRITTKFNSPKAEVGTTPGSSASPQSTGGSTPEAPTPAEMDLLACAKCYMVYYCNKTCQKKAWLHHHKQECETLAKGRAEHKKQHEVNGKGKGISSSDGDVEDLGVAGVTSADDDGKVPEETFDIFNNMVRMAIRFLLVFKGDNPVVPDLNTKSGKSLDHLFVNLSTAPEFPVLGSTDHGIATLVKGLTGTPLSLADVALCVRSLYESRRPMVSGIIKEPCHPPHIGHVTCPGYFVEPVVSLFQHSCEPNCRVIILRNDICVQPLRHIPAGEELTLSYVSEYESFDYEIRKKILHDFWGIQCYCEVCKGGSLVPQAEQFAFRDLVHHAYRYTSVAPMEDGYLDLKVEHWLERLNELGCGAGKPQFPMFRRLWYLRISRFYRQKNYQMALGSCLALYTWLERKDRDDERMDSLYLLCDLLHPRTSVRRTTLEDWSPIPADVRREFHDLYFALHPRLYSLQEDPRKKAIDILKDLHTSLNVVLNWVGYPEILDLKVSKELFGVRAA